MVLFAYSRYMNCSSQYYSVKCVLMKMLFVQCLVCLHQFCYTVELHATLVYNNYVLLCTIENWGAVKVVVFCVYVNCRTISAVHRSGTSCYISALQCLVYSFGNYMLQCGEKYCVCFYINCRTIMRCITALQCSVFGINCAPARQTTHSHAQAHASQIGTKVKQIRRN